MDWLGPLAGVIVGGILTHWTKTATLRYESRERRRETFRNSLGAAKTILAESNPQSVAMSFGEHSRQYVEERIARWQEIQPVLEGEAVLEDNEELRNRLSELIRATNGTFHWLRWLISDMTQKSNWRDAHDQGVDAHREALQALDAAALLVRAETRRRRWLRRR